MMPHSIPCLFAPPDDESVRIALARCIALIQRRHGLSLAEVAHAAGCHANTIRSSYRRESTLDYKCIARLQYYFEDECFEPLRRLHTPETADEPTLAERLERIEREASAIKRELDDADPVEIRLPRKKYGRAGGLG